MARALSGPRAGGLADFQIATTTTALLATLEDVRPMLEGRPALAHARRVAPAYAGGMPKVFPERLVQT